MILLEKKNIKLTVEYDGTNYHGFQKQAGRQLATIQELLEDRLSILTKETIQVTAAGRTDAGVHALGQVVNFMTSVNIPMSKFPLAINSLLPKDIVVKQAEIVPTEFNARFSPVSKTYRYTIYNSRIPSVFLRNYAYHVPVILDVDNMKLAARQMVGRHDFRSFCASGSSAKTFTRNLMDIEVVRQQDVITIEATADGFLYHMVRIIVGTLVEVGKGKLSPTQITDIISAKRREAAGPTAPPQGLCLLKVVY